MEDPSSNKNNVMTNQESNDDPFADLTPQDNHGFKKLVSPMEFGSGAASPMKEKKDTPAPSPSTSEPEKKETCDEKSGL
eukprot:CAMPEP_0194199832 /NCGR_PEP_ID=MMETSP0156-20130528/695_1 /TAXON_ID=33649 /ORGANISM="Thalassionema nitzschioides, Strain L26-B" /LENGTH=78 /DNA_ID=CAMNT_0038924771 /DNA_START=64 /DNA_END=300 /DNA_ORIENTATION=-